MLSSPALLNTCGIGAFIGGLPLDDKYVPECITDPDLTPFERLGYVGPDNVLKTPFIVLRLREKAIKDRRLHDPMEIVFRRANMDDLKSDLAFYLLGDVDDVPEPFTVITEQVLNDEIGADKITWWVHNDAKKRKREDKEDGGSHKKQKMEEKEPEDPVVDPVIVL